MHVAVEPPIDEFPTSRNLRPVGHISTVELHRAALVFVAAALGVALVYEDLLDDFTSFIFGRSTMT